MLDTVATKPAAPVLTDKEHDWVRDTFDADPRNFPASKAAAPPSAAVASAGAAAASPPAAADPAPPAAPVAKTPEEALADFKRRYKNKPLYDKFGQDAADNMLKPEDRLTPTEVKVGGATVDKTASVTVDDRGVTTKKSTVTTAGMVGDDGKPIVSTREQTKTVNVGLGNASVTTGDKRTVVDGDNTTIIDKQTGKSVDIVKGEVTRSDGTTIDTKGADGVSTRTSNKTTDTVGMSGATRTKDESTQVGDQMNSKSTTAGVMRSPGQLGAGVSQTKKSGTMTGPADDQKMDKGTEVTRKANAGMVSDDKGTGIGATASQDTKTQRGKGVATGSTVAAGGRCQTMVKEITDSEPPRFMVTTTISFNVSGGASASKENAPRAADDTRDNSTKANASISVTAGLAASASFSHELSAEDAQKYVDDIKANGRGSKLPEHQILATGASEGWAAAQKLWGTLSGSAAQVKALKPGESIETNVEASAGGKVAVGGGESQKGGLSVGAEYGKSGSHKVNIKKVGLPDGRIQITATIDDAGETSIGGSAGMGAAGMKGGTSHGEGSGRAVVFNLDPKDPEFDKQLAMINGALTVAELDKIAAANRKLVAQTTDKTSSSDGTTVGANVGPVAVDLGGKGTFSGEVTRDADGKIINQPYTGTNQSGGTAGVGDFKVGDSKTEAYTGSVDKDNKAKGELSESNKHTSVSKTLKNLGNITDDPVGTVLNPSKLLADEVDTKGTAIADKETMAICAEALNKSKWNSKVGGYRMDDWIACGNKIRAAITVKDGVIVNVNKGAVQKALAEWTKSDSSGRNEVVESIIRPLGGIPTGKAFAFPDGMEGLKGAWDSLVIADPLEPARALLADKKPAEALAAMQKVKQSIASLYAGVKSARSKWVDAGMDVQHAEMLGHINTRINEIEAAIRDIAKTLPKPVKPGETAVAPKPEIGPPSLDQANAEAQNQRDEDRKDLEIYNNNIETMKGYAETVFNKLGQAEAKLNDNGFFSGSATSHLIEVAPWIKQTEDLIKIWDGLYWPTYKIYEKLSPRLGLDKSRLEKIHVAGAKARWKQVYDMTRDTSMAGRG